MNKTSYQKNFDTQMEFILEKMSSELPEDKNLMEKIHMEIQKRKVEKNKMNKIWNRKRLVAMAACMVLLIGGISYGVSKISSLVSSSNTADEYAGIMPEKIMKAQLGTIPKYVEKFSSGFIIDKSSIGDIKALDDSKNTVASSKELHLSYKNSKEEVVDLFVTIHPELLSMDSDRIAQEILIYQGISLSYNKDPYKFVPENYQPTREELDAMRQGTLFISYGMDEIENTIVSSLSWKDGTLYYSLHTEEDLSKDELSEMAKEVIHSQK